MPFVDYYPNAQKAITLIDIRLIGTREYLHLIKLGQNIKKEIEQELKDEIKNNDVTRYYFERIVRDLNQDNLTPLKKEIIIATALLPDSKIIAEILNENGFTINDLTNLLRFRNILKNNLLNDLYLDKNMEKQFETYKNMTYHLIELFKKHFDLEDQTIILNRICTLITNNPELFIPRTWSNNKKR